MKTNKRVIRRKNKIRMKKKAKKIYPYYDKAETLADHLACCSCTMCGNPRKHFKDKTIQEKKEDDKFKYWMDNSIGEETCFENKRA